MKERNIYLHFPLPFKLKWLIPLHCIPCCAVNTNRWPREEVSENPNLCTSLQIPLTLIVFFLYLLNFIGFYLLINSSPSITRSPTLVWYGNNLKG